MGIISTELKFKLHKIFKQLLLVCDLRVIFKILNTWRIISTSETKLSDNYVFLLVYNFRYNSCNAEYLGKTKRHAEREPWNILEFPHSQWNVSKITIKLQLYLIICFFVRQLFLLKIFQFLLIVHVIANLRFMKI